MRLLLIIITILFTSCNFCLAQNTTAKKINDNTFITSDGVALYLKVSGNGAPCIFIHGGPGAWSKSFEDMGGNALEQKLTMYYFDQRGCGRSQSPTDGNYTMERMIRDIEELRTITGSEKVYLIAHSFGGVLAFNYAKRYPQHVNGLILLNATLDLRNSLSNQIAYVDTLLKKHISTTENDSLMAHFFKARKLLKQADKDYKMLSDNKSSVAKIDSIDDATRNSAFAQVALTMPEYTVDFTKQTSQVNVPVLIISGSRDHSIGPDHYKRFHFPNQRVKLINGGHILYFEENGVFVNAMFDFIR
ncbi:alpha/beta fold hydrolase [Taibaiella soli]|uniref:Alpha/beta hydrolase n=1 Tax=Taibaiella soli TaxID=1649169 RepID=A0A2W2AL86_9BACT|nr:alpha/beta hydrolase [Taibaiella soli]PZF74342.1 alpha/beta hydrolase [Taibaiella soli]